jgi:hypothetical protein
MPICRSTAVPPNDTAMRDSAVAMIKPSGYSMKKALATSMATRLMEYPTL